MRVVPSNRLLTWVALLIPCLAAAPLIPGAGYMALLFGGVLAGYVLLDLALSRACVRGISISLPPTIRLTKSKPASLPLRIHGAAGRQLRLALPLPPSFASPIERLDATIPDGAEEAVVEWNFTASQRGQYTLNACYFEVLSPYGFWQVRGGSACRTELRVYPNLLNERKRLASLFLNRGSFGMHTQRMLGQGRDFEKLRDYIPGDSYDDIHWKATAKRGKPITKLYQVERTQEIYVALDSSRLSARAMDGASSLEHMLTAALTLGLVAQQQGDIFGMMSFNDRVRHFVRAATGKAHYDHCRDALYTLSSRLVAPDYEEFFSFVRLRLRRRALIFILTDLADPLLSESFLQHLDLACRQHLVMVAMLRPPAVQPLFSAGDAGSVNDIYGHLSGHMNWRTLRELEQQLSHRGVDFALVDDTRLSLELVTRYMNIKARQAL